MWAVVIASKIFPGWGNLLGQVFSYKTGSRTSQEGRVSKAKPGSVGYKARRRLTSRAAQVRTQGKVVSLNAAPEPAGRRCMGGGEEMRLLIVQYQSWPSMQAARPLGGRGKRLQSLSVQSEPRQHGHPKADSSPGWENPAPSASPRVSCAQDTKPGGILGTGHHPWPTWWPLLDSLQCVSVPLVSGSPKLDTVLQVWSHKHKGEGIYLSPPCWLEFC